MKALVTGATGFLGRHLVKTLVRQGHTVVAMARSQEKANDLTSEFNCDVSFGDVCDAQSLEQAFLLGPFDVVFHLAAVNAVSKNEMDQLFEVNVMGTHNVVEACVRHRIDKLIHVSSIVAIGARFSAGNVMTEESSYDIARFKIRNMDSKRQGEALVIAAARARRLHAVVVNPALMYGPGDAKKAARKGQVQVARGRLPFYTAGGVNIVGVDDVVKGLLLAVDKGRSGERYILGGNNVTIKELFENIAQYAGVARPKWLIPNWLLKGLANFSKIVGLNGPASHENILTASMYYWFDHSKANVELGYSPEEAWTSVHRSVDWMRDQGLLNR